MDYDFLKNGDPGTLAKPYLLSMFHTQTKCDIPGIQAKIENESYMYRAKKTMKTYFVGKRGNPDRTRHIVTYYCVNKSRNSRCQVQVDVAFF